MSERLQRMASIPFIKARSVCSDCAWQVFVLVCPTLSEDFYGILNIFGHWIPLTPAEAFLVLSREK